MPWQPPKPLLHYRQLLSREDIQGVVNWHLRVIQQCYEAGLEKDGTLTGKTVIRFVILPSGEVGESKIASNTLPDTEVATCMCEAVRMWRFPASSKATTVTYPFNMTALCGPPTTTLPCP